MSSRCGGDFADVRVRVRVVADLVAFIGTIRFIQPVSAAASSPISMNVPCTPLQLQNVENARRPLCGRARHRSSSATWLGL